MKNRNVLFGAICFLSIGGFAFSLFSKEERKLTMAEASSIMGYACEKCTPDGGKCCDGKVKMLACSQQTPTSSSTCPKNKLKFINDKPKRSCIAATSGNHLTCIPKGCGMFSEWECDLRFRNGTDDEICVGGTNLHNLEDCDQSCP